MSYQDVLALTSEDQSKRWNAAAPVGTPTFVTYSFGDGKAAYDWSDRGDFMPWSEGHREHVRAAFDTWAAVSGLVFLEIADDDPGQIRLALVDTADRPGGSGRPVAGHARYPEATVRAEDRTEPFLNGIGGDVFLDSGRYGADARTLAPGMPGFSVTLHEIGHAIGFKHPFEGTPTIAPDRDNATHTVLSYDRTYRETALGSVDVEAARYYYGAEDAGYAWDAGTRTLSIAGTAADDVRQGTELDDIIRGLAGDDTLHGGPGADRLYGGEGDDVLLDDFLNDLNFADTLDGGPGHDIAVLQERRDRYAIVEQETGFGLEVSKGGVTDTLFSIEQIRFADRLYDVPAFSAKRIDPLTAAPDTFMDRIRDFDGNDLGAGSAWERIGAVDTDGDGAREAVMVNATLGRWASVGTDRDGLLRMDAHGEGGNTRVVGTYIDPLIALGQVAPGSAFDSQRRFAEDLSSGNIAAVLGGGDYDRDGLQEVYFALGDGSAYLHAYMHADGNIRYANYQVEEQVVDFLDANGHGPATWDGWFA